MANESASITSESVPIEWLDLVRLEAGDGLAEALKRFCDQAFSLLPAFGVSITILLGQELLTAAASGSLAVSLDELQYALDEGPCVDAASESRAIVEEDLDNSPRWPRWTPAAVAADVHSVCALDLHSRHGSYLGALNLYGSRPSAFMAPAVVTDLHRLARHAVVLLDNATVYAEAGLVASQLRAAMESRSVIEQAKGILMAREHITADTAWEYLVKISQGSHLKLRDVAARIVTTTMRASD